MGVLFQVGVQHVMTAVETFDKITCLAIYSSNLKLIVTFRNITFC